MVVVASLSTHRNRCVEIKFQVVRRLDELFKLFYILELGITVEKKSSMVRCGFVMVVKFLEIFDQVVYALGI